MHVHHGELSRVTTIEGLYITDLCEPTISVNSDVKAKRNLRTPPHLDVLIPSMTQIMLLLRYTTLIQDHCIKILKTRKDLNYSSKMLVFSQKQVSVTQTAVGSMPSLDILCFEMTVSLQASIQHLIEPQQFILVLHYSVQIPVIQTIPKVTIVGIYHSPKVPVRQIVQKISNKK